MCNIAGFIGDERAAPILIQMMKQQEGFNGGYYTGIATVTPDGKVHHAKVVGDVDCLLQTTNAAQLPGNVGIIHSRTKSGGDREWAHPFVSRDDSLAYVANGSTGLFETVRDQDGVATSLEAQGYPFMSRSKQPVGKYPRLSDGSGVHVSEVMCRLIESYIDAGNSPAAAMQKAYVNFPSEIVGLIIQRAIPESIVASRINQPLMIGRHATGWFLSSTAMAFPKESLQWLMPMPPTSTAVLSPDGIEIIPFHLSLQVADPIPWEAGRQKVLELLADGQPKTLTDLRLASTELWPQGELAQAHMMLYELFRRLDEQQLLKFETVRVPGVNNEGTVPETRITLNN